MARKPSTTNLPAYRYEVFDKILEEKIKAFQKEFEEMKEMNSLHTLVVRTLEPFHISHEHKVAIYGNQISIHLTAQEDDLSTTFLKIAEALAQATCNAGLRKEANVPTSLYSTYLSYTFACRLDPDSPTNIKYIRFDIKLPDTGIRDILVITRPTTYTTVEHIASKLEYPRPVGWSKMLQAQMQHKEQSHDSSD